MRQSVIILALAGLLPEIAAAQSAADTLRLTMDQAVARALAQGEEMRLARAEVAGAEGQVQEAFSAALPKVDGLVAYTRQFASIYQGLVDDSLGDVFRNSPFGAVNAWILGVTAEQTLWSGGKVGAGLKAAKSFRAAAASREREAAGDLVFRVKRAYLDAAYAGRLVTVAEASLEQAREHLVQVARYRREGTRAEYDLLRAQVDVGNQEPTVVAARNQLDLALRELKRLVNLPEEQALVLEPELVAPDGTIPVLAEDAGGPERAAMAAADASVVVQEQLVRVARADRWPTLSVGATFYHQSFPRQDFPVPQQFVRNWFAEVKLNVPIFSGFRTEGSIRRAEAALEGARAERQQVAEQIALETAQARAEVRRTQKLLAARRVAVEQASRAHYLAGVRYANGLATQLEVTDGRLLLQQAEWNEVQAMRDYHLALAELERALGRPVPVVRQPLEAVASWTDAKGIEP